MQRDFCTVANPAIQGMSYKRSMESLSSLWDKYGGGETSLALGLMTNDQS